MPKVAKVSKVIGVVGSRRRATDSDYEKCGAAILSILKPGDRLVSGGCPTGGDAFAERFAKVYGLTITIHYPNWNGPAKRGAGFVRNTKIAEDCDVLIALVAEDRTGGTEDTVKKAMKLGKKVIYV
jgi:hypothetical protein